MFKLPSIAIKMGDKAKVSWTFVDRGSIWLLILFYRKKKRTMSKHGKQINKQSSFSFTEILVFLQFGGIHAFQTFRKFPAIKLLVKRVKL